MSTLSDFTAAYTDYLAAAKNARTRDHPERQLVQLFINFVTRGFGVNARDFVMEQTIFMAELKRTGYMDALFGDTVFEFKRQLSSRGAAPREQLEKYMRQLASEGRQYTGFVTDGLKFEAYILDGGDSGAKAAMVRTDQFDLETLDAESAFVRLDSYLFSQTNTAPTAIDVVGRFGGSSPTFLAAYREMERLLKRVEDSPMLEEWRTQWRRLLSKVYGSEIGSDALFLRHTYLCQFARLLAYGALRRGLPDNDEEISRIVTGDAFYGWGVSNIGENDFFSWLLMPQIRDDALRLLRRLAEGLIVYDLKRIDQDLLKQLYQNLVDPETRHDLGEYYTPDWLAELTLEDIDYRVGQSLLDPACGSGSFLFSAIKRLHAQGLGGWELVRFAIDNIMGMDVHPLAVTVARVNYLLALSEPMQAARPSGGGLLTIPVFMADALVRPLEGRSADTLVVPVDERRDERFHIPHESALSPSALTDVIDLMDRAARRGAESRVNPVDTVNFVRQAEAIFAKDNMPMGEGTRLLWTGNLRLLTRLIAEDRNSIWSYILKNLSRPLVLAERKFDVIAGNPPWLSYRYINSADYQDEVKRLYQYYGLIEGGDVNQFSNMDLSTLFYTHARDQYLKADGTLAFVMPRAVITGAKQHRPFQAKGISRALDLLGVGPLFNVPTCVLVWESSGEARGTEGNPTSIPAVAYTGRLPRHEMSMDEVRAGAYLTSRETSVRFVDSDVRSPHYYERFKRGGDLFPRNLCFVRPDFLPSSPAVVTDPEADQEAKKPWKGVALRGLVADPYIYATLLSKHLIPFGYEKLHMVALPVRRIEDGRLRLLEREDHFAEYGDYQSWDWFQTAAAKWNELKKDTTIIDFFEQVNYRNKLTSQNLNETIKVMYLASGVHLASYVLDTTQQNFAVHGRITQGFVVDTKCYYYTAKSVDEAHFLCALLNSTLVDEAIKDYQSRGKGVVGQRDIHRTPFEACAIPPFDATNADHLALSRLSQEAHAVVEVLKVAGGLKGGVVSIRRAARAAASVQIAAIDALALRVLG